ncbi:MAG: hypothetical protein V3V25_02395 [Paracoccaceae bacterium]
MPNPRLLGIVTVLLIVGNVSGVHAAYTLSQLRAVESLISSQDCGALLGYLSNNSELLDGDDPLAEELRKFSQGVQGGLIDCVSVAPGTAGTAVEIAPSY